jgi:signal transduction histidine kinase
VGPLFPVARRAAACYHSTMLKVLHIEDDTANRALVRKVLSAAGFMVIEADDGISGIKKALAAQPDVILLDIGLPDMDGYEVTLKLRGELAGRDVPIVAITGRGDKKMSAAVGCDGLITKPIDIGALPGQVLAFAGGTHKDRTTADRATDDDATLLVEQSRKIASRLQAKIEELEETNQRLLESEKVRDEFYRNLSHELSTPLTPAVGYLSMLRNGDLGALSPLQTRAIDSINRGVTRVRALVDNLLDMTALSTGKMAFFPRPYDFNAAAHEAIALTLDRFKERGIALETEIPDEHCAGYGDPDKLKRAMVQLLENAVKFCRSDEGRVHVSARSDGGRLSFLVYDSGQGIPENELEAIFKTFYQIDGSITREHGGTGIGLALARRIIERFGGEVWAESPPQGDPARLGWAQTMVGLWVPDRMIDATPGPEDGAS